MATPTEAPDRTRIRRLGRAATVLGGAVVAGAILLATRDLEWSGIWFYQGAWAGTLAALAGGLAWRTGRPPMGRRAALSLFFWSAPFWYLFELLNLRLANWYYVFVPADAPTRWAGTFLAFTTVLPALYLGYRWARELGLAERWRRPRFRAGPVHRFALAAGGVAFVALSLTWPRAFFPLVWGALTLLIEPWNHARDPGTSLLGDLERGRYARLVRLLAGGLFIGGLWELYNSFAVARWIYTVPGLEGVKLFEMPLPGFLGFPILALDGYVVYRALEGLGVAVPAWGEGDPVPVPADRDPAPADPATAGADGRSPSPGAGEGPACRPGSGGRATGSAPGGRSVRPVRTAIAGALALLSCVGVQTRLDRWTVDSVWPTLEELPAVDGATADRLRRAGVAHVERLAALDSAGLAAEGLSPATAGAAARAGDLAALRGLGAANAAALWGASVRSICDLARAEEAGVRRIVAAAREDPRAGHPARVRVWLRAARARCAEET